MDSVNKRQQQWLLTLIIGIIDIIVGILLIVFKRDSLEVVLIIWGILIAINGGLNLLIGLKHMLMIPIVVGSLFLALGIILAVIPGFFTDILMILLAVFLIFIGVLGAISALDSVGEKNIILVIISLAIAVIMIIAGTLALFNLEKTADWVMIIIGVMMLVSGIMNVLGGLVAYKELKNPQ